jgi:hypothetical protein
MLVHYFSRIRHIPGIDFSLLEKKIRYEKRAGLHFFYITLDAGGYQRIVLNRTMKKIKSETRIFKSPDQPLRHTLSNNSSLYDSCTLFVVEGFEDALTLQVIIDKKLEPFFTQLLLESILPSGFYKIICTFGSATLHNIKGAIIIPDNSNDFIERKGFLYLKLPKGFKDLNDWVSKIPPK